MNLDERRAELEARGIEPTTLDADPLMQFRAWLGDATEWGLYMPEAMVLSTADREGRPSSRQVLLRGLDHGFLFFTNYESGKARDLEGNPFVALCFTWHQLQRQVRVRGMARPLPAVESDDYFRTRPRGSQIGAWASPQSERLDDRRELEQRVREVEERFAGGEVPRPPNWGGYRVEPDEVEFWQGRPSRLHDRFRYRRQRADEGGGWRADRLAP
jgi:pyridoxamine 5'-phosphate oxidase